MSRDPRDHQLAPNLRMHERADGSVIIAGQWAKGRRYEVMADLERSEVDALVAKLLGWTVGDVRERREGRRAGPIFVTIGEPMSGRLFDWLRANGMSIHDIAKLAVDLEALAIVEPESGR